MKDLADHGTALPNGTSKELASSSPVSVKLASTLALLERAVRIKDTKLLSGKLLRKTAALRKELSTELLSTFLEETLPSAHQTRQFLMQYLNKGENAMEIEGDVSKDKGVESLVLPEVEAYSYLLFVMHHIDKKQFSQAKEISTAAIQALSAYNRRTLDGINSRIFFYFSWAHECLGSLSSIRGQLLALHRTAVLRHDAYGQEMLLNLLLRNYLDSSLYDQAEKLRSRAHKGDVWRNTQQLCRYLYYLGRIRAVKLEYTDAKDCLQQAARKAPAVANGFRVTVNKWLVVVRLLLGEIPEHSELQQAGLQKQLKPYFALTQAVRVGDLSTFLKVAETYDVEYQKDKTHNLVVRLRQNVIKTGLRRINLAYSRISLADVAKKLGLASVQDTESILAKAIRDGGIDASIEHTKGWMTSKETLDVYATSEPQSAFHARVAFCLDVHNEAVKAMRFEESDGKQHLETAETIRERAVQDEELAKQIQEEEE